MQFGHCPEEVHRLIHRQLKNISDIQALVSDLQRLAIVALARTRLAGDIHRRQEVHFDLEHTIALALLAAPAFDIEAETSRVVAPHPGRGHRGEEVADFVEHPGVGGRVGPRGATNRCLIDDDALLQEFQIANLAMRPGALLGSVPLAENGAPKDVVNERGLAAATDAGHASQRAQRDAGVDIAQVVLGGPDDFNPPLVLTRIHPVTRHRDAQVTRQVAPSHGTRTGHDLSRRPLSHQFPAMNPGPGPYVQDVIGRANGVFIVLYHDDRIAGIAQAANRL